MDIRQYRREYAIMHAKWEKRVSGIFYKALAATIKPVLSTHNPESILQSPWIEAYKKAYTLIGVEAARLEYKQLKSNNPIKADDPISFYNETWRLLMQRFGSDVALAIITDLNETTLKQIQAALIEAANTFATNSQTTRLILQYTMGAVGRMRARRIARTETTTASNRAKEEGARTYLNEIGETEGYKMWISRADSHVRHDHMVIDNTAVPFDDVFNVGGFEANLPGDNTLPAKERVNCRCTFVTLSASAYRRRLARG